MEHELEYEQWLLCVNDNELSEQQQYDKESILNQNNRNRVKFDFDFGDKCNQDKGKIVETFCTGNKDANAFSNVYECGGIYNNNFGDVMGNKTFDCFWDCSQCKNNCNQKQRKE